MADSEVTIAVDLGASSGRVIAAEVKSDRIQLTDVHRFENSPVSFGNRLHWNLHGLWQQIEQGLSIANKQYGDRIASIGVDTWGVDYVLLDRNEDVVGPGFCYRDARTTGMMKRAFELISQQDIFEQSGVQFMEINTLYQLLSMRVEESPLLDVAEHFLMIPDFVNWLLTGQKVNEYTNASTTQLLHATQGGLVFEDPRCTLDPEAHFQDARATRDQLGRTSFDRPIAHWSKGTVQVIAPATHDTGSAVIAVPADGFASDKPDWCYISSGTWSLMGVELAKPILTSNCRSLNFTNEGGANGSVRLLKNIAGLWPFQQCRASWLRAGTKYEWSQLTEMAAKAKPLQSLIDLDHPKFVAPNNMVDAIVEFCRITGQPTPSDAGAIARAALEASRSSTALVWDG